MSDGRGTSPRQRSTMSRRCRDHDAPRRDPDAAVATVTRPVATVTRRVATSNPTKRCT